MKNITITLLLSVFVAACSSGNTVSDIPQNVTNTFQGSFTDNDGQSGSITLNLNDNNQGVVTGNIIVTGNSCLQSGSFDNGTSNGFNITISDIVQAGVASPDTFQVVTTTTVPGTTDAAGNTSPPQVTVTTEIEDSGIEGMTQQTLVDGTTIVVVTTLIDGDTAEDGTLSFQLAVNNNGSTLSGTFVAIGGACQAGQGSGSITLNG